MKRSSWLARSAVAVWLAWAGLLASLYAMLRLSVWHPHYLPVTGLLVVLLAAAVFLLAAGTWRVIRGPRRLQALACLLLGTPPLWFLAGHLMFGFSTGYGRQFDLNLPLRLLVPLGESLLDLAARFQYPQRTEGERVVMISQPVADAREQVAAMDRHIRALELQLGRTGVRRVHWVRGPIFGLENRALLGICMGSLAAGRTKQPGEDELMRVDRHEVAHVVLSQFCSPDTEPPAVLVEGWAEFAADDMQALRLRALSLREEGRTCTLREFIGPEWYGRHEFPVYIQGPVLVDSILRRFGPQRFVELYATSRRATFAADCQRILGVSIDELDAAYWADLDRFVGPGGYPKVWLESLPLGPDVNPGQWKRFVADYLAAAERLLAPYQHVRWTAERVFRKKEASGETSEIRDRLEMKRSGSRRAMNDSWNNVETVDLADPAHSFHADREPPAQAWRIHEHPPVSPERTYRRIFQRIDERDLLKSATAPLLGLANFARSLVNPIFFKVDRLERFTENGRHFIRLGFENYLAEYPVHRSITMKIAADDFTVESDGVDADGDHWRTEAVYETTGNVPLLKESRTSRSSRSGEESTSVFTITDREFGPVPDDEFTPERLLGAGPVQRIDDGPDHAATPSLLTWFRLPIIASLLSLGAGAGVGLLARGANRAIMRDDPPSST